MRCEMTGMDEQCAGTAEVRADCTPAEGNEVGQPGTLFLCKDCADSVRENPAWTYALTDMESGEEFVPRPPAYREVPVLSADTSRAVLKAFMGSDQFRRTADEVLECIARWEVSCVSLEVTGLGVVGCTRAGEKVLVRF